MAVWLVVELVQLKFTYIKVVKYPKLGHILQSDLSARLSREVVYGLGYLRYRGIFYTPGKAIYKMAEVIQLLGY